MDISMKIKIRRVMMALLILLLVLAMNSQQVTGADWHRMSAMKVTQKATNKATELEKQSGNTQCTLTFGTISCTVHLGPEGELLRQSDAYPYKRPEDATPLTQKHTLTDTAYLRTHTPLTTVNQQPHRQNHLTDEAITTEFIAEQTFSKPNYSADKKLKHPKSKERQQTKWVPRYKNQRFIKPPLATADWQHVVRKKHKNSRQNKICFFCQKKGHLKRFCWQRIKCYNCGKTGHKEAKCLFKHPKPHTQIVKQKQQETATQSSKPVMDYAQIRPPLTNVFRPLRQTLNEENEYLTTVRLIILI